MIIILTRNYGKNVQTKEYNGLESLRKAIRAGEASMPDNGSSYKITTESPIDQKILDKWLADNTEERKFGSRIGLFLIGEEITL